MSRIRERLRFEQAQVMGLKSKATKHGLLTETRIGVYLTPEVTEAMGLGAAQVLADDYESARPRIYTLKALALLSPNGLEKHELEWEIEDARGFTFTWIEDAEATWCDFVLVSKPPLEPIARYWDICGTAPATLTVAPHRDGEQAGVE